MTGRPADPGLDADLAALAATVTAGLHCGPPAADSHEQEVLDLAHDSLRDLAELAARATQAAADRDDYRFWNERVRVCEHHTQDVAAPVGDCLICNAEEFRTEAARLREELDDARAMTRIANSRAAEEREAAEARCARLEEERDEYRIEADHGHDDYEDAEAVIRQIAETRPNQTFDPWARDLCQEFLDRPRRSRQTIQAIRERCARLQQTLAALYDPASQLADPSHELTEIEWYGVMSRLRAAVGDAEREALAGPDTPADSPTEYPESADTGLTATERRMLYGEGAS